MKKLIIILLLVLFPYFAYADDTSGGGNNIASDPLFVSATDFHLQYTSPAKNAGVDVGLTQDYESKPIRGLPDIGAYEYMGNTTIGTGPGMTFPGTGMTLN